MSQQHHVYPQGGDKFFSFLFWVFYNLLRVLKFLGKGPLVITIIEVRTSRVLLSAILVDMEGWK